MVFNFEKMRWLEIHSITLHFLPLADRDTIYIHTAAILRLYPIILLCLKTFTHCLKTGISRLFTVLRYS